MRLLIVIMVILSGLIILKMLLQDFAKRSYVQADLRTLRVKEQREKIAEMIKVYGDKDTYSRIKKMFKNSYSHGHNALHIFGEELYEAGGAQGISVCDEDFAYGCIHGFSTQALKENGLQVLKILNDACKKTSMEMACAHGLGHGVLEYFGHKQIEKALNACSTLPNRFKLYGCQDGVYMEYNFPSLAIADSSIKARTLNKDNTYSPCLEISEKYRNGCFYSLAQWWSGAWSIDFPQMGEYCAALDNYFYRRACFLGIGNEASPNSESLIEDSVERCKTMPTLEGETVCRAAVYTNFYSYSKFDEKIAEEACNDLPEREMMACQNYSIIKELKD